MSPWYFDTPGSGPHTLVRWAASGLPWSTMNRLDPDQTLRELHRRGATRLQRVRFRDNRRTLWSLTQGGRSLNLHEGYRQASPELLDALAIVARAPRGTSPRARQARSQVRAAVEPLLTRGTSGSSRAGAGPDCATPEQQAFLRALVAFWNERLFEGRLPADLPIRLSSRMRSTLGWVAPSHSPVTGREDPARVVTDLAFNADLMRRPNDVLLNQVAIHELAHVEAWLLHGEPGHGAQWKAVARRVGCVPRARPPGFRLHRRPPGSPPSRRVPPLPAASGSGSPGPGEHHDNLQG